MQTPTFRRANSTSCSWYAGFTDTCGGRTLQLLVTEEDEEGVECSFTHDYNSCFGCSELEQDPFVSVGPPHAEPVPPLQAQGQEPGCSRVHLQADQISDQSFNTGYNHSGVITAPLYSHVEFTLFKVCHCDSKIEELMSTFIIIIILVDLMSYQCIY